MFGVLHCFVFYFVIGVVFLVGLVIYGNNLLQNFPYLLSEGREQEVFLVLISLLGLIICVWNYIHLLFEEEKVNSESDPLIAFSARRKAVVQPRISTPPQVGDIIVPQQATGDIEDPYDYDEEAAVDSWGPNPFTSQELNEPGFEFVFTTDPSNNQDDNTTENV